MVRGVDLQTQPARRRGAVLLQSVQWLANVACVKQAAGMRPRPSQVHYDEEPDDDDDDEEDERRERDLGDLAFILLGDGAAGLGAKAGALGSSVAVVSRVPVELGVGTKGAAPTESTSAFGWPTFAISASD